MARWTIELRKINNVFDFDYPFYDMSLKSYFEDLFIRHYAFHEIGYQTIGEFKFRLQTYLMENYDTFKQLYEIELRCKQIDFMSNKDYVETLTRNINENELNNIITKSLNDSLVKDSSFSESLVNNISNFKESNQMDGVAFLNTNDTGTTNINETKDNNQERISNNSTSQSNTSNTVDTNDNNNRVFTEEVKTIGKGNIGITSSSDLKIGWKNSITNLNLEIINGARDLFIMRY